jgi:hypothetical protein
MNSGARVASPSTAVRGRPPGRTVFLSRKDHQPRAPAGALRRQMSANQGQDPCESASRADFVATPTFRCQEKANVNSPGNE